MSTRILFADDSVTAQNMGKRILTEAGYEVVAVSNGAAAVKKIAEQKPDIIILDLYMPGYSGLEVCEKIRGSMATLKTPVLLTVGKMEPYRPEDANRVRADGVIVKPFEASDLLAIIKKFEERIVPAPPPLAQQVMETPPEEELAAAAEFPMETVDRPTHPSQATVDVPDHMASSSAFTDLLGMEPADASSAVATRPAGAYQAPPPTPPPRPGTPEYELPASWRREEEAAKTEIELPPEISAPEPPQHDVRLLDTAMVQQAPIAGEPHDVAPPLASSRPLQIPVYQESAEAAESQAPELMPTAVGPIGEIEIPRDPYLQETAAETTRNTIATATEPGLVSGLQPVIPDHLSQTQQRAEITPVDRHFSVAPAREIAVDVPVETSQESAAQPKNEAPFSDADFESRVAAALASYNQTENSHPATEATSGQPAAPSALGVAHESELPGAMSASTENFEHLVQSPSVGSQPDSILDPELVVSTFEYHPPVGGALGELGFRAPEIASSAVPGNSVISPEAEPVAAAPQEARSSNNISRHSVENEIEANVGIAAQTLASAVEAQSPASRTSITQAVSRAMERLKPELVDEILRELKSKE